MNQSFDSAVKKAGERFLADLASGRSPLLRKKATGELSVPVNGDSLRPFNGINRPR